MFTFGKLDILGMGSDILPVAEKGTREDVANIDCTHNVRFVSKAVHSIDGLQHFGNKFRDADPHDGYESH